MDEVGLKATFVRELTGVRRGLGWEEWGNAF